MRSQLNIRVDADTLARIKAMAKEAGATTTDFVVQRTLAGKLEIVHVPELNEKRWADGCGHRANLNQLTRRIHQAANAGMLPSELGQALLAELKATRASDRAIWAACLGKEPP